MEGKAETQAHTELGQLRFEEHKHRTGQFQQAPAVTQPQE